MGAIIDAINQCTGYVQSVASWINLPGLGDAGQWLDTAPSNIQRSSTPVVGAVAVWRPGVSGASGVGHVAYVQQVLPGGQIQIAERNWPEGSWYHVRTIAASSVSGFLLPPGTSGSDPVQLDSMTTTNSDPNAQQQPAQQQTNGLLHFLGVDQFFAGVGDFFTRAALIIFGLLLVYLGVKLMFSGGSNITVTMPRSPANTPQGLTKGGPDSGGGSETVKTKTRAAGSKAKGSATKGAKTAARDAAMVAE